MRGPQTRRTCRLFALLPTIVVASAAPLAAQETSFVDPVTGRDRLNAVLPATASYDPATQYMIIDVLDVSLPGRTYGTPSGEPQDPDDPGMRAQQDPGIVSVLHSLGQSTGSAFQLTISSDAPVRFNGAGIVVEPVELSDSDQADLDGRMSRLAARSPVTRILNGYCLEFVKGPPTLDQAFRIADAEIQELYAPAANVLKAGRQLIEGGFLEEHPLEYVHSIKQWALWTAEEGSLSIDSFSKRFLAHAEDNFTVAGMAWNDQIEALVSETLETRWDHIGEILQLARDMPGGIEWQK